MPQYSQIGLLLVDLTLGPPDTLAIEDFTSCKTLAERKDAVTYGQY